jgi:hypothetical protein
MRPFRRLLASVLTGLALTATAPTADAAHPPTTQTQAHNYVLYYRASPSSPWTTLGYTPDARLAAYYVNVLRSWGYEAFYR